MLFIYSPVGRLVLNSLFGTLNGTKYFQWLHWYSLLVQVKLTVLSPYFHYHHLNLHWLFPLPAFEPPLVIQMALVNEYILFQILSTVSWSTKYSIEKKKSVLNPHWSINYRSTLWMRYKTKPRDNWSMANIFSSWYLYKKHFPTTNHHWPVNHCGLTWQIVTSPPYNFTPYLQNYPTLTKRLQLSFGWEKSLQFEHKILHKTTFLRLLNFLNVLVACPIVTCKADFK